MSLGEKIHALRRKKNLKQVDLANALQVSPQAVSKWEKDGNAPDILLIVKLARLFNVTTDYLLGVHDPKQGIFEATVFYSSLRDFAKRSTQIDSQELAAATNVIFYHLTEEVLKYDGVPVKYVGDGFLSFFSGASHADRAVQAALRSKKIISNDALLIALNSGNIYLGSIGHPDYSSRDILGETVNLAFLSMPWVEKNCASGIGLTENTFERLEKKYPVNKKAKVYLSSIRSNVKLIEIKKA